MPVEFATNALDLTNPRIRTRLIEEAPLPSGFMGGTFLPMEDEPGDKIWIEILKHARLLAPFSDIDAEAPQMRFGDVLTQVWADALEVKAKVILSASDLRKLREFGGAPLGTQARLDGNFARRKIARSVADLDDAIVARIEWLQMNALLGQITYTSTGDGSPSISITYPVSTATASPLWSDVANADPLTDIWTWTKDSYLQNVDYEGGDVILPPAVMYYLGQNAKLRAMFAANYAQAGPGVLTDIQIQDVFRTRFGMTLHVYKGMYTSRTDDGSVVTDVPTKIWPDNKIVVLPNQVVGHTGTVPHEEKNWGTGKYTWNEDKVDPIRHMVGEGWGGMPVVEYPKRILVATVGS